MVQPAKQSFFAALCAGPRCAMDTLDDVLTHDGDSDSECSVCQNVIPYDSLPEVKAVVQKISSCIPSVRIAKRESVKIGDLDVPRHGDLCVAQFEDGRMLAKCIEQCHEALAAELFTTKHELLDDLVEERAEKLSIAISDPDGQDCPLVFVSRVFQKATGYSKDFCVGRSCRFLQPSNRVLNDAVNVKDRERMRDFCCKSGHQEGSILTLLLNERHDGTRFWNLLKMVRVLVSGKAYVVARQMHIEAYMPTILHMQIEDRSLNESIAGVAEGVIESLHVLRKHLKYMPDAPLETLLDLVSERLDKMELVMVE